MCVATRRGLQRRVRFRGAKAPFRQASRMPRPSPLHAQDPTLVALGGAIRRLRKERGVSQEQLADLSTVERAYMGSIEKGDQNPGIILIMRIVGALDITLTELAAEAKL
jgi:DNA-binding XRE family transcriptional regulator